MKDSPHRFDFSRPGMKKALADVYRERLRAEEIHGPLPPGFHAQLGILMEEVGELAQAVNENLWTAPCHAAIRAEAVQVAAVALGIVEKLDRHVIPSTRTEDGPKSAA